MTFAKSQKLSREVKWLGRRMSLHSRYRTSWSGRPSAYFPGLSSGTRSMGLAERLFAGTGRFGAGFAAFLAMASSVGEAELYPPAPIPARDRLLRWPRGLIPCALYSSIP